MHPRQFVPLDDQGTLGPRKLIQTGLHGVGIGKVMRQLYVGGMVTRFDLKQLIVKVCQLRIAHMLSQQIKTFARARFDQSGDQQAIDSPPRFLRANELI